MGKIDDNGTMRDPSSEETTQIGQKIKGGISPEYELIKTIDVSQLSEPVSMITITEDEDGNDIALDDVFIDFSNIKVSSSGKLAVQTYIGNTNIVDYTRNNSVTNVARTYCFDIQRTAPGSQTLLLGGYTSASQIYRKNNISYGSKVSKINIITDDAFEEGIVNIYGKVKY